MRLHIPYSATEMAFIEARKGMPRKYLQAAFVEAFGRNDVTEAHLKSLCTRKGWTTGRAPIVPVEYSQAEMEFVEANQAMPRKELHAAFAEAFGRRDVTVKHIQNLLTRMGWTKQPKAPNVIWSNEEIEFVEANQTLPRKDLHAALVERFGRTDLKEEHVKSLCARRGFRTGRTGTFEKGTVPPNKGQRCPEGKGGRHPNARRTQFKKGNIPHTYRGPGHEWIDAEDGYVRLIIAGRNPHTGADTCPVLKHKYLWEQINGPVPDGHALKCLDGVRTNTDPSNWACVSRGLLPRLNGIRGRGYDAAPDEIKPLIMQTATLAQRVYEIRNPDRSAYRPAGRKPSANGKAA